jgi:hypothetical protein
MRHAEFNFIVPFGMVATILALFVGAATDLLAIIGFGSRNNDMASVLYQKVLYGTVLSGVAALFCIFFTFKARFLALRLLAPLTALGMASRVAMTWRPSENIRLIMVFRLIVSSALGICCWLYDRRFQSEQLEREREVHSAVKVQKS